MGSQCDMVFLDMGAGCSTRLFNEGATDDFDQLSDAGLCWPGFENVGFGR